MYHPYLHKWVEWSYFMNFPVGSFVFLKSQYLFKYLWSVMIANSWRFRKRLLLYRSENKVIISVNLALDFKELFLISLLGAAATFINCYSLWEVKVIRGQISYKWIILLSCKNKLLIVTSVVRLVGKLFGSYYSITVTYCYTQNRKFTFWFLFVCLFFKVWISRTVFAAHLYGNNKGNLKKDSCLCF